MVIDLITQTPIYAWVLLLYLLFIGWRATKPRTIWVPQLFLVPFILTLSKFLKLLSVNLIYTLAPWIAGLLIGTLAGSQHKRIEFLLSKNAVRLPGSSMTLVMFLVLFGAKYSLNVLQTMNPDWCIICINLDTVLTFIFAGYSFSKATTYTIRFLQAKSKT